MNSSNTFYKVIGELRKGTLRFKVDSWEMLIETNRYYEIKPKSGAVKRIYKEKLNVIGNETKYYVNGIISCSTFCKEEQIQNMQLMIAESLQFQVNVYMNDLKLNQKALEQNNLIL